MSELMRARSELWQLERSISFYFESKEDMERIRTVATQGEYCCSAFGHLQKKLSDNHRWSACERLDQFRDLARRIHEMELTLIKEGV